MKTTPERTSLTVTQVAAIVRKILKDVTPSIPTGLTAAHRPIKPKWSVTTSKYAGGASIDIRPINFRLTPDSHSELYHALHGIGSCRFNYMDDSTDYVAHVYHDDVIHHGAHHVSLHRPNMSHFEQELLPLIRVDAVPVRTHADYLAEWPKES